jgi:hypothetical protein
MTKRPSLLEISIVLREMLTSRFLRELPISRTIQSSRVQQGISGGQSRLWSSNEWTKLRRILGSLCKGNIHLAEPEELDIRQATLMYEDNLLNMGIQNQTVFGRPSRKAEG